VVADAAATARSERGRGRRRARAVAPPAPGQRVERPTGDRDPARDPAHEGQSIGLLRFGTRPARAPPAAAPVRRQPMRARAAGVPRWPRGLQRLL